MGDGFLAKQIRRNGRNNLILGLCFIGAIATICWLNTRNLYNFFKGPFPISGAEVASLQNPNGLRQFYVTVQGERTFTTGIEEKETVEFFTSHHPFLLTKIGDKFLLVKSPEHQKSATIFKGGLVTVSSEVQNRVVGPIVAKNPELSGLILPVMLDGTYFDWATYLALGMAVVVFIAAGALVISGSRILADAGAHPIWKTLSKEGVAQQLGGQLDAEMRSEGGGQEFGAGRLTSNWLVAATTYSTHAVRLTDVAWAYQRIVKHYQGFIPTGKSISVKVFARDGRSFEIPQKKDSGTRLLETLKLKTPWIAMGFTPALEKLWKTKRAEFISSVDQRKNALAKPPASPEQRTKELVRA
jgi:hypothetical protein